uniref:Uncharacterized protein n=1 Tax=Micrurus lemniscatus lemniscatus TaxID=129467 RepID=A0A2D4J6A3_MICLE
MKRIPQEIKNRFPNQMVNMLSVCSRPVPLSGCSLACFTPDAWKTCAEDRDQVKQGSVRQPGLKKGSPMQHLCKFPLSFICSAWPRWRPCFLPHWTTQVVQHCSCFSGRDA